MHYRDIKDIKTNSVINGETISYSFVAVFSVFLFFALKQFIKLVFGLSAPISIIIAFVIAEIVSFLLERKFVFAKRVLSSNTKQILLFIFRAAVDFGFYRLSQFVFGETLKVEKDLYWVIAITLCVAFNYFFDRLLVFDCAYEAKEIKKSRIYLFFYSNRFIFLSGIICVCCLSVIAMIRQVFPFGDSTVMRMDLFHQYGPLFAEFYDRVIHGKSFLYSWTAGGGMCFLGNYFNYLSSPLSFLIFLFDKKDISFAITFLVYVKCILSSVTFGIYLKKSQNGHSAASTVFSVFYAFCAYFLAYYWNVMWLDGMFLLPLIILGIELIIKEGKCALYIASMAILFYSTYYMGYMCAIFSVIYFICYFAMTSGFGDTIDKTKKFKNRYSVKALSNNVFFNRAFRFAVSSLAAGALCAVSLIPVYLILRNSSATSDEFPKTFTSYYNIFDFLTSHLAELETTIRSSGDDVLPNVYSGVLTCLLLPLYIINGKYRVKEKTFYILMLLFLLFSFDNNVMNFLWHALHFPNDLPFRFSFMYSFLILVIAYKSLNKLDAVQIRDIGFVGMGWLAFIILAQKMPTTKMNETMIYLNIGFVIIWTAVLYMIRNKKIATNITSLVLICLLFAEVVVCDIDPLQFSQENSYYTKNYDTYTSAFENIHTEDGDFYREELCSFNLRMDPCYYSYNGMTLFSSMAYEEYSRTQYKLGMDGNRINSYTYHPQTPVYNMMFAIKYLVRGNEGVVPSESLFELHSNSDDYVSAIYKNNYFLPIAYCVNPNVGEWSIDEGDPFEEQEEFFDLATGYSNVFKPLICKDTYFDGMTGDDSFENGTFWFSKSDPESDYGYAHITLTPQIDGNVYLYVVSDHANELRVSSSRYNEKTQDPEDPYILDLGHYDIGDSIDITLDCSEMDNSEGYAEIYAYTCDEDIFEKGYNKLSKSAIAVAKHTDTVIEGTINVSEDSYLYTSIPYDESWSVYIDGDRVETFETANALLTASIKKGEHEIKFKYVPRGLLPGAAISAVTALGICGYLFYKRKQKNGKFDGIN